MRKALTLLVAMILAALVIGGCSSPPSSTATERDQRKQEQNAEGLAQVQPAEGMQWSPSRETANRWARTWGEEGKLAYIYLFDSEGGQVGYYIMEGLPVSYCASLTPPQKIVDVDKVVGGSSVDALAMPAPAMDGMYYGAANCQQMYGFDAVSGAYLEFTGGGSFNYLLSDQPMTRIDTKPLGDATVEEVENQN